MKLSATIITYNEERNIERCLISVQKVADEIIVVDSFSTDNTISICRSFGAHVILNEFEGYGMQKRFASEKASFDYILSLDADEELSEQLIQSIKVVKESETAPYYSFNRLNFYCGKPVRHGGWYPDLQIRLFDRRCTNWNERSVHESVEQIQHVKPFFLKGDLNHYTTLSIDEHRKKEEKYARINAEILIKKGKSILFITPYLKGVFRFFKTYILKAAFLDGRIGWIISITLAKSSYLKYKIARCALKNKQTQNCKKPY